MHVIAGVSPDNTPSGYYWTFLFPMLLFIVIALILWALFGRPHQRVPASRISFGLSSRVSGAAGPAGTAASVSTTESAGTAGPADAPMTTTAEPAAAAGAGETDDGQTPADGAGAGE